MTKGKKIREKGKIRLSEYFKNIDNGSDVAIVNDLGYPFSVPLKHKGKSGKVIGGRGEYKLVKLKDGGKSKIFIVHPVHLKRL